MKPARQKTLDYTVLDAIETGNLTIDQTKDSGHVKDSSL